MKKVLLEIAKFIYAMSFAVLAMLVIAFVLDLLAAVVSKGWVDYSGHMRVGLWPILRGTFQRIWLSPLIHVFLLWLGIGGIVRGVMGSYTPKFLRRWSMKGVLAEQE